MKRTIILLSILCASFLSYSQAVKVDATGNYISVSNRDTVATKTGKTFTDNKGNTYPVMISKNGKLFVIRTSGKTGKQYKQYLKLEN